MAEWFFQLGGNALGPTTANRLAEMASDGRLATGDLIRRGDQTAWVRAEDLPGLKFSAHTPPPAVALESRTSDVSKMPPQARLSIELKSIATATLGHISRIPDWILLRYGLRRNHYEALQARIDFGKELFEAGRGSPQEREALQVVFTELATADAKQVVSLNLRRDELLAELAKSSGDVGALVSPAFDRLARLSKGESEIRTRLSLIQRRLLPTDSTDRRRITLGYAALGLLVVVMFVGFGTGDREHERADSGVKLGTAVAANEVAVPAKNSSVALETPTRAVGVTSGTAIAARGAPETAQDVAEPAKTMPSVTPEPRIRGAGPERVTRLHNNGSSLPICDFMPGTMFKNGTDMKILFSVPDGTACIEDKAYIGVENDFKKDMAKVEILEGDYRGKKGWVPRHVMQVH